MNRPDASLSGGSTGSRSGLAAGYNPFNVDFFGPGKQTLKRWLQRLEGAFHVSQITENRNKAAYLLHFVGVEAFGSLCDCLDPVDSYSLRTCWES